MSSATAQTISNNEQTPKPETSGVIKPAVGATSNPPVVQNPEPQGAMKVATQDDVSPEATQQAEDLS